MSKCLIAEYQTSTAANLGLEALLNDRFKLENLSFMSSASDPAAKYLKDLRDEPHRVDTDDLPESRTTSLGMLIGGTVAAPIAAGTLIGPFIIAGPLVGMAIGAAIGSLLRGLEHWGVSHDISGDYERRVKSGSVLLIVHDVDDAMISEAETRLESTNPKTLEKYEVPFRM
jgi:hypothetical protein